MDDLYPRRLAFLLLGVNLLNYLDRYLVPALLPLIAKEFQLTNEQSGYLVSAFIVGYVLFSPIFGYFGDRAHRPTLMVLGVAAWSVATFLCGWVSAFVPFVMLRMCIGLGEASYGSIAPGFIKDRVNDPIRLTRELSIFFSAIPVGSALGYVLGSLFSHEESWRYAFMVGGIPGLLLCLFLWRVPDIRCAPPPLKGSIFVGAREVVSSPLIRMAVLGYVFQTFALVGISTFISSYGVAIGFELQEITSLFGGILVVTGFIGTLVGGRVAARWAERSGTPIRTMLRFLVIASLLSTPFVAAAFLVEHRVLFLACCFAAELFVFATTGPVNSVIVSACPPALVTLTQGMTILAIQLLGGALAPILIGIIADRSTLALGLQLCTLALLLSALVWWCAARMVHAAQPVAQ